MRITLSEWAKQIEVSRQTALLWFNSGRLPMAERICRGVILVDKKQKRPKPMTPWQIKHEEEKLYCR